VIWRPLALLLFALNLAAFGYISLNPQHAMQPRAKAEIGVPSLTLLSERNDAQMQQQAAIAKVQQSTPDSTSQRCRRLGPFIEKSSVQRAFDVITNEAQRLQIVQDSQRETRGYWVYLPSSNDRESALKASRQLSAGGIRDYYVVTAGENENAISLGMFKDAINADKRIAQITALGFFPKRIERFDEIPRYFLEFLPKPNQQLDRDWLRRLNFAKSVNLSDFRCDS
jgi:hypothetical protein